jgi:hypothetical protein
MSLSSFKVSNLMGNFRKAILMMSLTLIAAGIAVPAAATDTDQALKLCHARGSECKAMKITAGDQVTVIICVNNSSSGQGVECVQCPAGQNCSVVRRVPATKHLVEGVLSKNKIGRRGTKP